MFSNKNIYHTKNKSINCNLRFNTKKNELTFPSLFTGDLVKMGRCLNVYREQKKIMAPSLYFLIFLVHVFFSFLATFFSCGFLPPNFNEHDDDLSVPL